MDQKSPPSGGPNLWIRQLADCPLADLWTKKYSKNKLGVHEKEKESTDYPFDYAQEPTD
jgi:hypothetical protein